MAATFFRSARHPAIPATTVSSDSRDDGTKTVIESISDTQWRVCDTRWPEHDPHSLRGFIENRGDLFEVMQLDHGFEWFSFTTLDDAIDHFVEHPLSAASGDENVMSRLRAHAR